VYEYNDAGMTVAEIAHEIGIGKGEVRLILSLRKNRSD
jgi:predicted transcriptional regulator